MENPTAFQIQYRDYQRQMAWVNSEGWQFDPPKRRKQVRGMVAHRAAVVRCRLLSLEMATKRRL